MGHRVDNVVDPELRREGHQQARSRRAGNTLLAAGIHKSDHPSNRGAALHQLPEYWYSAVALERSALRRAGNR